MRPHEHAAESQSGITRVLVTHFHTPLPDGHHIRGVLPTPTDAIRIVTGPRHAYAPKHLAVWEMPLTDAEGLEGLTPWRAWDALRSLHTPGAAVPPSTGETLGMPLTQVDPWNLTPAPPARDDGAYVALYALTHPSTSTPAVIPNPASTSAPTAPIATPPSRPKREPPSLPRRISSRPCPPPKPAPAPTPPPKPAPQS